LLASAPLAAQEFWMPHIFGDHMVIQAGGATPVWGNAPAGASVRLTSDAWQGEKSCLADAAGHWSLELPAIDGVGPFWIEVQQGDHSLRFDDVLVGEVWLCGGQSNMEWTLGPGVGPGIANWQAEVQTADLPQIRLFDVPHQVAATPMNDSPATWRVCSPQTVERFSAVGFLFGRRLHKDLARPIGLISCNWGGTVAEAWTSRAALEDFGEFANGLEQLDRLAGGNDGEKSFAQRQARWWQALAAKDAGSGPAQWFAKQPRDAGPWQETQLPGAWESGPLGEFDGIAWYRRAIELPADWVGKPLQMSLGAIDDYDTTWVNGQQVGATHEQGQWQKPRIYEIPAELVTDRNLTIAVRVLDTGGAGGFTGPAGAMALGRSDTPGQAMRLDGTWWMRKGTAMSKLGALPTRPQMGPNQPTALFNGMLSTVAPYAIRGAIWYQGESNRTRAMQYQELFPRMIADWRKQWGRGDFPFYFVQIAPFQYGGDTGQAAALREAQSMAMSVANTGMAVTMDVGNPRDIHPSNKQDVADRLARWALARTYGKTAIGYRSPSLREARVEAGRLRLYFDGADSGLRTRDGAAPSHFQVAGKDQVFQPATAVLEQHDGQWTVVVQSDSVPRPVAVRYAWGAADQPNLENAHGLPASSFRSDRWSAYPGQER